MVPTAQRQTKWAVENRCEAGTVRVMETYQKWVAVLVRDRANEYFRESGRSCESIVVKLD